jgi:hypothetical protein
VYFSLVTTLVLEKVQRNSMEETAYGSKYDIFHMWIASWKKCKEIPWKKQLMDPNMIFSKSKNVRVVKFLMDLFFANDLKH